MYCIDVIALIPRGLKHGISITFLLVKCLSWLINQIFQKKHSSLNLSAEYLFWNLTYKYFYLQGINSTLCFQLFELR